MYSKAKAIFDATVSHTNGREKYCETYKELENELKCLQILDKFEVYI